MGHFQVLVELTATHVYNKSFISMHRRMEIEHKDAMATAKDKIDNVVRTNDRSEDEVVE